MAPAASLLFSAMPPSSRSAFAVSARSPAARLAASAVRAAAAAWSGRPASRASCPLTFWIAGETEQLRPQYAAARSRQALACVFGPAEALVDDREIDRVGGDAFGIFDRARYADRLAVLARGAFQITCAKVGVGPAVGLDHRGLAGRGRSPLGRRDASGEQR